MEKTDNMSKNKNEISFETTDGNDAFDAFVTLSRDEQTRFIAKANGFMRSAGSAASKGTGDIAVGSRVKILAGSTKYAGMIGEVVEAKRVRCFVKPDGTDARVYLFKADLVVMATETINLNEEDEDADEETGT